MPYTLHPISCHKLDTLFHDLLCNMHSVLYIQITEVGVAIRNALALLVCSLVLFVFPLAKQVISGTQHRLRQPLF